jgi:hypothetical protein
MSIKGMKGIISLLLTALLATQGVLQIQAQTASGLKSGIDWSSGNSLPIPTEPELQKLLQQVSTGRIGAAIVRPMTPEQGTAAARRFLTSNASQQAMALFAASPDYKDAGRSTRSAAGAMIYGRPLAALAGLLRANELQPNDPTILALLAAVVSYLGQPNEALAILGSPVLQSAAPASPVGMGGKAALLNTRGY